MTAITVDKVTTAARSITNRMPDRVNESNRYVDPANPDQRCLVGEVLASLALPLPGPHDQLNEASVLELARWYASQGIAVDPEATELLRELQHIADRKAPWATAREEVPALMST